MSRRRATIVVAVLCFVVGCGRSRSEPAASPQRDAGAATNTRSPLAVASSAATPLRRRPRDGATWNAIAASERGIACLAKSYSATSLFDDPYITNCTAPRSGCKKEFRELDHAILVLHWIPQSISQDPRLAPITQYSTRVEASWLDRWRNAGMDLEAIDLYALFPYYFRGATTKRMVSELVKALGPAGDWEGYDAHGPAYRKVTDELWPILALARNHVDDPILERALERKREEANRVLHGDWQTWPSTERFYALSHIYLAFLWTEREGYDIGSTWPLLEEIEKELARVVDDPELSRANAALEQALFVLSEGGYHDKQVLSELAAEIAARQTPDGCWHAFELTADEIKKPHRKPLPAGFAAAHTTLMAIAGFDRFSRWDQYVAQREWRRLAGPNPITRLAASAPPEPVYATIRGERVKVAFPMTQASDIEFLNELRMEPENSVVFFREQELTGELAKADPKVRGAAVKRILDIRKQAAMLVPSRRGIALQTTPAGSVFHVALELYGPAATQEFADRVKRGIEQAWQGRVGGSRLSTEVQVAIRRPGTPASDAALPVYVPDRRVMPSTQREGDTGDRPTTWPPWISERTIAHEMGHYFGFPDAYHIEVRQDFYYLVYDRPDDLMSSPFGAVQREQLEQLVRAYRPPEAKKG